MQLLDRAAIALGVSTEYANELQDAYWEDYGALDDKYQSPECRDGGDFDLSPDSDVFP